MSTFRLGDRFVLLRGQHTRLRLSISALAEIASGLGAQTPSALGAKLRSANLAQWNLVLRALSDPKPQAALTQAEMADLLPSISDVMTHGLSS